MAKGKFKRLINKVAKRVASIPGPIGDIAKGVDDIIDDNQFVDGTNEEASTKEQRSEPDTPNPPTKKWFQQVPMWGWIAGGVLVLFGVYKMMSSKQHKGGRNVRY